MTTQSPTSSKDVVRQGSSNQLQDSSTNSITCAKEVAQALQMWSRFNMG